MQLADQRHYFKKSERYSGDYLDELYVRSVLVTIPNDQ